MGKVMDRESIYFKKHISLFSKENFIFVLSAFTATSALANEQALEQGQPVSSDKNVKSMLLHSDMRLNTVNNKVGQDPLQVLWNEIKKNHSTITVDTDDIANGAQRFELHDPESAETNNQTGRFDDVKLPQYHSENIDDNPDESYDPDDIDCGPDCDDVEPDPVPAPSQAVGCGSDCAYVKNNTDPDNYPLNKQPLGIYGADNNISTRIGTLPAKDNWNTDPENGEDPHLKGVVITLNHHLDLGNDGSVAMGKSKIQNGRLAVGNTEIKDGSISVAKNGPKMTKQGIDGADKKITHIADGTISATSQDAVTGRQLYQLRHFLKNPVTPNLARVNQQMVRTNHRLGYLDQEVGHLSQAVGELNQRVGYLNQKIDFYNKREERGIATAMAMSGLPQPTIAGDSMMAISGSDYRGHSSIAIGYSEVSDNDKEVVKFDTATNLDGKSDIAATIGYGYQW